MESRDREVGRRMGFVMPRNYINGEAEDVETIVRLRPWIEDEWRNAHGDFSKTKLTTDYDPKSNIFKFTIQFIR
jgi:hypothetical protein